MRTKEKRKEARIIATRFLAIIESNTPCQNCGGKPIEWHNNSHPDKPNNRVSSLRTQGCSIERIQREIAICTPLCRRCHMKLDGRLASLLSKSPYKIGRVYVPPRPCLCCGVNTKRTRNGMCSTCDNHHSGRRLRKGRSCDGCCSKP